MTTHSHVLWSWILARNRSWRWPFAIGAGLPDLPYLLLGGWILATERELGWGDPALWRAAEAHPYTLAMHSFVPVGAALVAAHLLGGGRALPWLAGILGHVALDAATHVSDAYPLFWPLSDARFPAPISAWEPEHGGRTVLAIEQGLLVLALLAVAVERLRRRRRAVE